MRAAVVCLFGLAAFALEAPASAGPAPSEESDQALPELPPPAAAEPPAPDPLPAAAMRPWLPGAEAGAAASLFPASVRAPAPQAPSPSASTPVVMNGGSRYGGLS